MVNMMLLPGQNHSRLFYSGGGEDRGINESKENRETMYEQGKTIPVTNISSSVRHNSFRLNGKTKEAVF